MNALKVLAWIEATLLLVFGAWLLFGVWVQKRRCSSDAEVLGLTSGEWVVDDAHVEVSIFGRKRHWARLRRPDSDVTFETFRGFGLRSGNWVTLRKVRDNEKLPRFTGGFNRNVVPVRRW